MERVGSRTLSEHYRSEVSIGEHVVVVDEPLSLGGGDLGPTPFDLLCAALASCTTITLRMYADRKKWPLEEVIATVEHRRIPRGGEESLGPPADWFLMEVELIGELDADQRRRLGEVAGRCPVHRTLSAEAVIQTSCR